MNDLEAFYRRNVRLVYALALAQAANPCAAEDLTQETFLRAWRHFDRVSRLEPAAQRSWLARTLRHLAIDGWRRERSVPMESLDGSGPPVEPAERMALRLDVSRALAALEPVDRQLVVLRYFMEMNSREIGEMLEMPEGTVRHRLLRCRRHLAEHLAPWNPEGE